MSSEVRRRHRAGPAADGASRAEGPDSEEPPEAYQGPWIVEALVDTIGSVVKAAWQRIGSYPSVQAIWRTSTVQYVYALFTITVGVFFQKFFMFHLGEVDYVGGPAHGLTAIVTGPTSGIGAETAAALTRRGAKVILACRSVARGNELMLSIQEATQKLGHPKPEMEVWLLDLASLQSVREFGAKWEQQRRELHILLNNAGIFNMGAPRSETEDSFEAHIGSNHLGHFLLSLLLVPSLMRGAANNLSFGARIVNVSSANHLMASSGMRTSDPHFRLPKSYDVAQAYAQSKLAQILFTKEMRRRLGPSSSLQVFAVHPGMVLTNVARTLPVLIQQAYKLLMQYLLLTPSQGSRASIYAATSPSAPREALATGGYFDANCKPVPSSPSGQDMAQALWVWKWSAEQVGLPPQLDLPEP